MATAALKSVSFEVFGRVQGVFFRKHTESQAKKLGLSGWVKNTSAGTVVGVIEGPEDKVAIMKTWLEKTGSPESRIDKCVFSNEQTLRRSAYRKQEVQNRISRSVSSKMRKELAKNLFQDFL